MIRSVRILLTCLLATCAAAAGAMGNAWQESFDLSSCRMVTTGKAPYFVLEPGFRLELEGGDTRLQITVLDETRKVDGVETRVVEEREWKNGALYEVSRNYFAMCEQTKDVYYFGEDVDFYKDGMVTKHDGSWLAGQNGNKAGLIMPGAPAVKMRYYQEVAPGVAMDRAEVESLTETCNTPAGIFRNCLKIKETSAIEPWAKEYKYHAPGIGLIQDEDLKLVRYGYVSGPARPTH
jgi:hypothetical protein